MIPTEAVRLAMVVAVRIGKQTWDEVRGNVEARDRALGVVERNCLSRRDLPPVNVMVMVLLHTSMSSSSIMIRIVMSRVD